jgi:hypothetical protein
MLTAREAIFAALIENGPMCAVEIAECTGKPRGTVNSCISHTRKTTNSLYIADWKRNTKPQGSIAAIYAYGEGCDARRIAPMTSKERNAAYRKQWAHVLRLRCRARRGSIQPTWLNGLGV